MYTISMDLLPCTISLMGIQAYAHALQHEDDHRSGTCRYFTEDEEYDFNICLIKCELNITNMLFTLCQESRDPIDRCMIGKIIQNNARPAAESSEKINTLFA